MHVSFPARSVPVAIFAAMLALVLMVASSDEAYASFNPTGVITIVDPSPGANSDIIADFNISSPDVNFGGLIAFTPPEFTITPGGDITDGAIAGTLTSTATLGLISGACNSSLLVNFTMLDSTIDPAVTVPFLDPEVKGGNDGGDTEDDFDDQFDVQNGLPLGVTRYPDYLSRIFETQTPISRTYGQTEVSGIPVSLNFIVFPPGTIFQEGDLPTDPRLGYPSVTVLQSIGDPDSIPQPGAITDFCAPLVTKNTNFGITQDNPDTAGVDEGGAVRLTNPTEAGTYTFTTWAAGLRDADGDGWENLLDVCAFTPNPEWDPRERVIAGQTGDIDGDALPDACDPFPNETGPITGGVFDEDRDQYGNRQDNCPLVANSMGSDVQGEKGTDNQADEDGDQIGDACDPNPNNEETEGARPALCITSALDIGAGGTPAVNPADVLPCNPNATLPTQVGSPTPTLPPGQTPAPTTPGSTGGVTEEPDTGIGSLSPTGAGIPLWALLVAGVSLVGLLAGFGLSATSVRASNKDE